MLATRQNLLDHAKQSARDALKTTSKRVIQKKVEAAGDLIGIKIAQVMYRKITQKQLQMNIINKYYFFRRKTESY